MRKPALSGPRGAVRYAMIRDAARSHRRPPGKRAQDVRAELLEFSIRGDSLQSTTGDGAL